MTPPLNGGRRGSDAACGAHVFAASATGEDDIPQAQLDQPDPPVDLAAEIKGPRKEIAAVSERIGSRCDLRPGAEL